MLAYLTQYAPRYIAVNFATNWVIPNIFQGIKFRFNAVSLFKSPIYYSYQASYIAIANQGDIGSENIKLARVHTAYSIIQYVGKQWTILSKLISVDT